MMKKIVVLLGIFLGFAFAVSSLDEGLSAYESKDYARAFAVFNELCYQNKSAKACYSLGYMYENGVGMSVDKDQAKSYYKIACQDKLASACFNLALLMSEDGEDENAVNLTFFQACNLQNSQACEHLGLVYESKKDGDMALEFYTRACNYKNGSACYRLGDLFKKGTLIKQNTRTALHHYQRSCELKFSESCYVLGRYYQEEKKDNVYSKKFLGKACELGHLEACEAYKQINLSQDVR